MATQYMAAVPAFKIATSAGSLAEQQDEISSVLDILFLSLLRAGGMRVKRPDSVYQ